MAIRLLATYEFIDKDGTPAGMVRLPVVDYAQPDSEGRERPRVLLLSDDDPHLVDFRPDSTLETQYGTLEALLIDAVADPIPAQPGWVAEVSIEPLDEPPERLGVYPVLAWEPEPNTSLDDGPQGHAVLLIPNRDDRLGSHSGPVSTRDLLIYAVDESSRHHAQARPWLERATLSGTEEIGFEFIESWLDSPVASVVHPTERHAGNLRDLLMPSGTPAT